MWLHIIFISYISISTETDYFLNVFLFFITIFGIVVDILEMMLYLI